MILENSKLLVEDEARGTNSPPVLGSRHRRARRSFTPA
jgi:hypothetical protein